MPTPSQRFVVQDIKLGTPRGSEAWRLIDRVQLVEGFPHNYPAEAVELAAAVIVSLATVGLDPQAIAVMRRVAEIVG